jgi:large subunit ribosomal protein L4
MTDMKVFKDGKVESQAVDPSLFGERVLGRTLKDAVVMYEANVRAGTAKAKTRGEVAGPNKKLWKQKHTGRARMGSKKVSHWRGGGVVFGPQPRDYSYQMPKRARRVALRNAVFTKFSDAEVSIASGWPTEAPSTKAAVAILSALGAERSTLVVTHEPDQVLVKSLRNVPHVDVRPVADLNAHQVLLRRNMVLTPQAFEALKERLGANPSNAKTPTDGGAVAD